VVATSGWALALFLVAVYTLPAFVLVYELDLYEREPVPMVLGAFAWGAFAATGLSLDAAGWNEVFAAAVGTDAAARWSAAVVAPLIEEGLKASGLVLLALIARDEIDDLMDGFVYGAVCGLGFAVIEDVAYFVAAFGGSVVDMAEGFAARILASGLYGHVLYTGLVGMAIGSVVSRRSEVPARRRIGIAAVLAILGVAGHALWNSPFLATLYPEPPIEGLGWLRVVAAVGIRVLPLVLVVAVAVTLARRRERGWLASALASATQGDAITPEEASTLAVPGGRRRAIAAMRRRAGRRAASLLGRLQREQITLAMLVADRDRVTEAAIVAQRSHCRSLRIALAAIPGTGA
jgi:RsiW-degrading membrane proteinase PrsW (M82 family)